MKIRKARISDAQFISQLIQDTLEKINIADYSPQEIEAWKGADTPEKAQERIQDKNRYVCVAVEKNEIVGVGSLKGDEITAIYVKSSYVGKGVGSLLLHHIEKIAKQQGNTELSMDSSLTAVKFYEKHGYEKDRNSCHQADDVKLNCVVMKKKLPWNGANSI